MITFIRYSHLQNLYTFINYGENTIYTTIDNIDNIENVNIIGNNIVINNTINYFIYSTIRPHRATEYILTIA